MPPQRFKQLMMERDELVMDVGSVLDGDAAVEEGLIDRLGGLSDAVKCLYELIDEDQAKLRELPKKRAGRPPKKSAQKVSAKSTPKKSTAKTAATAAPKKRGRKPKTEVAAAVRRAQSRPEYNKADWNGER